MIDLSLQKEVFIQYASTLSLMIDFVKYHSIQIVAIGYRPGQPNWELQCWVRA